jgi:hypothetical protein
MNCRCRCQPTYGSAYYRGAAILFAERNYKRKMRSTRNPFRRVIIWLTYGRKGARQ